MILSSLAVRANDSPWHCMSELPSSSVRSPKPRRGRTEPGLVCVRARMRASSTFMVPRTIKELGSMPLTTTGKIDRKLLAAS